MKAVCRPQALQICLEGREPGSAAGVGQRLEHAWVRWHDHESGDPPNEGCAERLPCGAAHVVAVRAQVAAPRVAVGHRGALQRLDGRPARPVSYTHLTLPTK